MFDRQQAIQFLTTNCDCWRGQGDRELLSRLSDDKLAALAESERRKVEIVNRATAGFVDDAGNAYRVNPDTGKWEHRQVEPRPPAPPPALNAGKKARQPEDDEEEDEGEMEDPDDDDEDDEDEKYVRRTNKKRVTGNRRREEESPRRRRLTQEEELRSLSPELQRTLQNAAAIERREKEKIIDQLIVNVAPADRQVHRERLMQRDLEELETDLQLFRQRQDQGEQQAPRRQPAANRRQGRPTQDDVLELPTIDWNAKGDAPAAKAPPAPEAVDNADADVEEDDWFRNAPPSVRSKYTKLQALESQRRRELIDQLTENVSGAKAKRLAARAERMELGELEDFVELVAARGEESRPSYFGASAAPLGNRQAEPDDDGLPLPRMEWGEKSA